MITRVLMQKLSWTMDEGKIVRWLKKEGEPVAKGEELLEVETEKVNVALESPGSGVLRKKFYDVGETVPVGALVGVIADPNESIDEVVVESSAKALPVIREVSVAAPPGPGQIQRTEEVVASPRARRLAREKGLDLSTIKGSGPSGRIVEEDILRAMQHAEPSGFPFTVLNTIQLTGLRKIISDRMLSSAQTKAQVTITTEVDMTEGVDVREKSNVTFNDLIISAVAMTLKEHRVLNSITFQGEPKVVGEINVGLAVATEEGLVVPVLRNADKLTLKEIAERSAPLVERARTRELTVADVSDGTFTITNLGMYDVDVNTAIINPPQSAILAVGRIVQKPIVLGGKIAIRQMMILSLTFDHRIIDGAPAASFLKDLKGLLEQPSKLLT